MTDHVDYHSKRAAAERERAKAASDDCAAKIHAELAQLHEKATHQELMMVREDASVG